MSQWPATADAVVVGAGIVGASCAHYLAAAGLKVVVIDRGQVAAGTTSAGEGNILVSDKDNPVELELARYSNRLWRDLAERFTGMEFEAKGGLVVAQSQLVANRLAEIAAEQQQRGVIAEAVDATGMRKLEPDLNPALVAGFFYPEDAQVQPMLAAAALLGGSDLITALPDCALTAVKVDAERVTEVHTTRGVIATPALVNAAGTWGAEVAEIAGCPLPIMPRRGFILVTTPMPQRIHHKVYTAEYLANVASDQAGLETSTVVESTRGGTVLIGASRERVGFDRTVDYQVLSRLAAGAVELFPFLRQTKLLRSYLGFRPYCPDHLPVIGADPRLSGLFHACGHEGAGVGLAPASGALIAAQITGQPLAIDLQPFRPDRFEAVA